MQLTRMFTRDCWLRRFRSFGRSRAKQRRRPPAFFCLTADSLTPNEPARRSRLLHRIDALLVAGGECSFFRQRELTYDRSRESLHKSTLRFAAGLSLIIRGFDEIYGISKAARLEALGRLFAQNVVHIRFIR